MKKFLYLAAICLPLLFTGCEKRIIDTDFAIYSTVFDGDSLEPIKGAEIAIQPHRTEVSFTGSDGTFQINGLDGRESKYNVTIMAKDYQSDWRDVTIIPGGSSKVEFALKKKEIK